MSNLFLFFVIAICLAIGFGLGLWRGGKVFPAGGVEKKQGKTATSWNKARYLEGLTYLLKEQNDEAIDRFVADMDVNDNTLDVHLSLGAMLRKKGEVTRAVKVHQNVLSQSQLSAENRHIVELELGKDYLQSGLLDRAESLFQNLMDGPKAAKTLRRDAELLLVRVYQDTKEWLKAIDIADRLTERKFAPQTDQWRVAQVHFACELAEVAKATSDWFQFRHWLSAAQRYDQNSVRASLLQAEQEMTDGKYPVALATLKVVLRQGGPFVPEAIRPIEACYSKLHQRAKFVDVLSDYLDEVDDPSSLQRYYRLLLEHMDFPAALKQLKPKVDRFPQCRGAGLLINTLLNNEAVDPSFENVIYELIATPSIHQCERCGFEGELHWLCPSCGTWESMALRSRSEWLTEGSVDIDGLRPLTVSR